LARYLQKLGVAPEILVGICVERSMEMIIGLLGILKAGGAYVPLDATYPKARLALMLRDAQVPVLLTEERLLDDLPEFQGRIVCLDKDQKSICQESDENPVSGVRVDNPAYLIYTSGSTGAPKGVLGLHRGAVNRFNWMWKTYPFEAEEVCCQKTSLSFVDSVWEIFGPLLQGITTIIIPDDVVKDPQLLIQNLASEGVTRIVLVPSLLRLMLDASVDLQSQLTNLKIWISSGEVLSKELAQRFRQSMPESILLNLYGSSEVSADSTWYDTSRGQLLSCIPIGRPIANTQIYLLDSNLKPVPVGVPAELHVGGAGVARGYLNRPELTREKFIPNPFVVGERLYKTGDLARYLPDGNIEFLGRIDHQVKIRGFRIELGEIESVLADNPAVGQAVVLLREDDHGENCLVAYIVPGQRSKPSVSQLVTHLRRKLPDYMVPAAFVPMNCLPLTPSGKVDRRALPAPEQKRPDLDQTYATPRSELEHYLSDMWCDILQIDRVGIHDRFFELGGSSIRAARFVDRLQRELGTSIYIISVFEAPSVSEYATFLKKNYAQTVAEKFPHEVGLAAGQIFTDDSLRDATRRFEATYNEQPPPSGKDDGGSDGTPRAKSSNSRWALAERQRQLRQSQQKLGKKAEETE
jgi:amino acid adenylation domain-containing protein